MADIKQAAKWMQEGKRVRRSIYGPEMPTGFTDNPFAAPNFAQTLHCDEKMRILSEDDVFISPLIPALLADDWEIAQ